MNNTAGPAESYNLTHAFVAPSAGWSVVFRNAALTPITNTGLIASGQNMLVYADVTVPALAVPGNTDIDFTVTGALLGTKDTKRDRVTVNTVNTVTLTPNNTGQVFIGGSVVYGHTLTNTGNVTQNITFATGFLGNTTALWTSNLYRDTGGTTPGALDGADPAVSTTTTFMLAPGASELLWVRVISPPGAIAGATNTSTVTATYQPTPNLGALPTATVSATDLTTVVGTQLRLEKTQWLDTTALCNGTPSYSSVPIAGAKPGDCIRYRIIATNDGATTVTGVVVTDTTPANTTYHDGVLAATLPGSITTPANGATGLISATVGALTPGQFATITFSVRIDPLVP